MVSLSRLCFLVRSETGAELAEKKAVSNVIHVLSFLLYRLHATKAALLGAVISFSLAGCVFATEPPFFTPHFQVEANWNWFCLSRKRHRALRSSLNLDSLVSDLCPSNQNLIRAFLMELLPSSVWLGLRFHLHSHQKVLPIPFVFFPFLPLWAIMCNNAPKDFQWYII